jgi:hypothetical protein
MVTGCSTISSYDRVAVQGRIKVTGLASQVVGVEAGFFVGMTRDASNAEGAGAGDALDVLPGLLLDW